MDPTYLPERPQIYVGGGPGDRETSGKTARSPDGQRGENEEVEVGERETAYIKQGSDMAGKSEKDECDEEEREHEGQEHHRTNDRGPGNPERS